MAAVLWMSLVAFLVISGDNNHQIKQQCKQIASVISDGDREIYKEEQNRDLRDLNYFSEKDYKIYESKLSDYDKQILVDCF